MGKSQSVPQSIASPTLVSKSFLPVDLTTVTSAAKKKCNFRAETRSFIKRRNKNGPKTDPCETQLVTPGLVEHLFLIQT